MTAKVYITIANGPSKFDLMTALLAWTPQRHTVSFVSEFGQTFVAHINSIAAEDGSGESWNLTGYVKFPTLDDAEGDGAVSLVSLPFMAYFRTRDRKGWFQIQM